MKDKTVVITGATSGLGRATAIQLAQKGAFVVVVARNTAKADAVIEEITKNGGKGKSVISDLSSMKNTKEAAEAIARIIGRLDVLINNAGAYFPSHRKTAEAFRIHPSVELPIPVSAYPSFTRAIGTGLF